VTADSTTPRTVRVALLVLAALLLLLGGRAAVAHFTEFVQWIAARGPMGHAVFVAVFALAAMAFFPAGLLTLAAGAIFGVRLGTVYAYAGALLGACGAFLVSRYIARDMVERHIASRPRVAAISTGLGDEGRRIVFLLRLSPVIPYSVINCAMGVTRIAFRDFLIGSLGMLPVTAMYVYYGSVAGTIVAATQGHGGRGREYYVALAAGVAATLIATSIITRAATHALQRDA
jgi:uncharacterized membrane protein YdjX (TVP38/TMEM64 family)